MKIAVRYMAQLQAAAGCAVEQVELPADSSLVDCVVQVAQRHGEPLASLLLDTAKRPQPSILLFVGDEQIVAGQTVALKDGDAVTLLSPMAGG
jgi:molybdopterin converting factor small subunit